MNKKLSRETIDGIRQRYAEGVPISAIRAEFEVSEGATYYWVKGGPAKGLNRLPPLPLRGRGGEGEGSRPGPRGVRRATIDRLWRTAARQVQDIELRLSAEGQEPSERERDARLMAVMVKTLRELAAFDRADLEKSRKSNTKDAPRDHDDAVPADIDELRRELARRVDLIRQRRTAAGAGGGDAA
jgi:hypothetical protein